MYYVSISFGLVPTLWKRQKILYTYTFGMEAEKKNKSVPGHLVDCFVPVSITKRGWEGEDRYVSISRGGSQSPSILHVHLCVVNKSKLLSEGKKRKK